MEKLNPFNDIMNGGRLHFSCSCRVGLRAEKTVLSAMHSADRLHGNWNFVLGTDVDILLVGSHLLERREVRERVREREKREGKTLKSWGKV
jgi:hypothetical protein